MREKERVSETCPGTRLPRLIRYPDRMRTVVQRRFAEEEDKSRGESEAIDIERKAPKARQWKYGGKDERLYFLPSLLSLSLSLSFLLHRSFIQPGRRNEWELLYDLFCTSSDRLGTSAGLFSFFFSSFHHAIRP